MVVERAILVTESSRGKLWKLLSFLAYWEAIVGIGIAVVVARPTATLLSHLPRSHHNLLYVFYTELLVGVASAVVALQGVIVAHASLHYPLLKSTKKTFNIWMVIGTALVLSLIAILIIIPAAVEGGRKEILEIMEQGVNYYLRDIEWKVSLDRLHQEYQCCGVNSISDWYKSRWIPMRSFRPEVVNLREVLSEDGTLGPRVVPASCCNPDVNQPCFHDTLQQNTSTSATLFPKTLFTRGCGELVVNPAASTVGTFQVLTITSLLLQAGQLVIGSYLYTGTLSSSDEVDNEKELKRQRKHTRICKPFTGKSCRLGRKLSSRASRVEKSPTKSLSSRISRVKSQASKIGLAIKNFAMPSDQSKCSQKYEVYCASMDEGSESPWRSDNEFTSPRRFSPSCEAQDAHLDSQLSQTLSELTESDAPPPPASPKKLKMKRRWWEPELDLLTLDF